jgi:cytochrome c553
MKNLAIMFCLLMIWAQSGVAADAAAGKSNSVVCSACHGADGNSMVPSFPKLAGQGEAYLIKQMKDIRDGARPVPTMAGQLDGKSDEDLADLAAYFASQAKSGGKTNPDMLTLGQKVFRAGVAQRNVAACSACHSPTGQGNAPAGFPSLAGQHAEYTATQLKMYRKGYEDDSGRTNDNEKIMRTIAFGLSDKEIEAVSSYIAGLK